jgi:hypothetical protein
MAVNLEQLSKLAQNESEIDFKERVKRVEAIFEVYDFVSVYRAIFIIQNWLPNISSQIRTLLQNTILAKNPIESFKGKKAINRHEEFVEFYESITPALPEFIHMEDYVPEPDWGEVKFHIERRDYKILYGCEISNIYDYLSLFQLLYCSYDEEYTKATNRSPAKELEIILASQETIIECIPQQPKIEHSSIELGHFECPPEYFFESAMQFLRNFNWARFIDKDVLDQYSVTPGQVNVEITREAFTTSVFTGQAIPYLFLKIDDWYFPIQPRRWNSILFDSWKSCYENFGISFSKHGMAYSYNFAMQLYGYVSQRVRSENLWPLVNAARDGKHHPVTYAFAFIAGNTLYLVHLTNPMLNPKDTDAEIAKLLPQIEESVELIARDPVSFYLNLEKQMIGFQNKGAGAKLQVRPMILVPQANTGGWLSIKFPKNCDLMFLDQFLGLFDELDGLDEYSEFKEFEEIYHKQTSTMISPLDLYSSFKFSHGLLEPGARSYTRIMLDPHGGSNYRYSSLKNFWELYPPIKAMGHPRAWKLERETKSRIRMLNRGFMGSSVYNRIGNCNLIFTSTFRSMNVDEMRIADLLINSTEDAFALVGDKIASCAVFAQIPNMHVMFFPKHLVESSNELVHLKHLLNSNVLSIDHGRFDHDEYGIRVVYDHEKISVFFESSQNAEAQFEVAHNILSEIVKIEPSAEDKGALEALVAEKKRPPRYRLYSIERPASFPYIVNPCEPDLSDFKRAKKFIAQLGAKANVKPGQYAGDDAKAILNELRKAVVVGLDSEIAKLKASHGMPLLIEKINALNHKDFLDRSQRNADLKGSPDYAVDELRATKHTNFLSMHKNYRYLIEKFTSNFPSGSGELDEREFSYFAAIADWLLVLYTASDNVQYGLFPVSVEIDDDYLVSVVASDDYQEKERQFAIEETQFQLGLVGNSADGVGYKDVSTEGFVELDLAFKGDFGFSFSQLMNFTRLLTFWPVHAGGNDATTYMASKENIITVTQKVLPDFVKGEIEAMLRFLTLDRAQIRTVVGDPRETDDVPIWEHFKRTQRYNLRPLIELEGKILWGPYSTRQAGMIWANCLAVGRLPFNMDQATRVNSVFKTIKVSYEERVVQNAAAIARRYSNFVITDFSLRDFAPRGTDPGDVDVLVYIKSENILLNIECKDIFPPYCLKDARRLKEKIMGRSADDSGYLGKNENREQLLTSTWRDVFRRLGWTSPQVPPRIFSIFCLTRAFWWTKFPTRETKVTFVRIELLDQAIRNILENKV